MGKSCQMALMNYSKRDKKEQQQVQKAMKLKGEVGIEGPKST